MSEREYNEALKFMEGNLVKGQGLVGIFWFDDRKNELFGVFKESPYGKSINCGGGMVSCSLLHKNLWKKEFHKQKFSGKPGPYIGDYKDIPRGRVFYRPVDNKFFVCVGSWISDYVDAIDLIIDEFCLENENYEVTIQDHWEIGMGYGD